MPRPTVQAVWGKASLSLPSRFFDIRVRCDLWAGAARFPFLIGIKERNNAKIDFLQCDFFKHIVRIVYLRNRG